MGPAQTAAMEAARLLGQLAQPGEGVHLGEVRVWNRCEALTDGEADEQFPPPPSRQATACGTSGGCGCCPSSTAGFTEPRWARQRGNQRARQAARRLAILSRDDSEEPLVARSWATCRR